MAKRPNTGTRNTTPTRVVILRPRRITMDHNTSDNSEATQTVTQFAKESVQSRRRRRGLYSRAWARLSAQRRRYDAVLEMQPRQYSMVWMAWYRSTSAKSNCKSVKKKKKKKSNMSHHIHTKEMKCKGTVHPKMKIQSFRTLF